MKKKIVRWKEPKDVIALWSGIYWGNHGSRVGLWRLAAEKTVEEGAKCVYIVGGLIDGGSRNQTLRELYVDATNKERQRPKATRLPLKELKENVRHDFIEENAKDLAKRMPRMENIKIYIITSPAYDKEIGRVIAERLAELRDDIWMYGEGSHHMLFKHMKQILGLYTPTKAVWLRGDYYDTPVLRVLKDEKKRSTKGLGDINFVGNFASAVFNVGDSVSKVKKPYGSLPVLYNIDQTRTSENQVGFRILKPASNVLKECMVVTYTFKDLIANEWRMVRTPTKSTKIQQTIVKIFRRKGEPLTIGQLEAFSGYSRDKLVGAIEELQKRKRSKWWPGIIQPRGSNQYFFDEEWFRDKFVYKFPNNTNGIEKEIGCGCIHAGCKWTDMDYFINRLPKLILETGTRRLVIAGDLPEGLYHFLWERGELITSRDEPALYDWQEELAAWQFGKCITKAFDEEFYKRLPALKNPNPKKKVRIKQEILIRSIDKSLIEVERIKGNHCRWTEPAGFNALRAFDETLEKFIVTHIDNILSRAGLSIPQLHAQVAKKIIKLNAGEEHKRPSGLVVSIYHPSMARSQETPSIRPQGTLDKASGSNVIWSANFHVAEIVEEWNKELGQRICMQIGTGKVYSDFEAGKLKDVDFGVEYLGVTSSKGRVIRTEVAHFGIKRSRKEVLKDNLKILKEYDTWRKETGKKNIYN